MESTTDVNYAHTHNKPSAMLIEIATFLLFQLRVTFNSELNFNFIRRRNIGHPVSHWTYE